jgi:ribosomally synthesized peptide (two-chain TOMM family)
VNNTIVSEMQQFGTVWPQCVARAWQDSEFREALKRNPAATLHEAYQFTIPSGIDLRVLEEGEVVDTRQANTLMMVIPPMPEMDMQQVALTNCGPGNGNNGPRFTLSATFC